MAPAILQTLPPPCAVGGRWHQRARSRRVELSAGADADSNSSPSTPRFGVLLSHLLLLLPPLLPHHDSLPPHPAHFSRLSHALRLLPPLPPYRRLRSLPRNCESACRMPMAHAVLTVLHALWQGIARAPL